MPSPNSKEPATTALLNGADGATSDPLDIGHERPEHIDPSPINPATFQYAL